MTSAKSEATRIAFSKFTTGVCIVTTTVDSTPLGMTVSSFNSVSLDPPLVLWSVGRHAPEYADFCAAQHYVVHILSDQQVALSNRFATPGMDKFEGLEHSYSDNNIPLLSGVVARFHCTAAHNFPAGDHNILVGQVNEVDQSKGQDTRAPLVYFASDYHRIGTVLQH